MQQLTRVRRVFSACILHSIKTLPIRHVIRHACEPTSNRAGGPHVHQRVANVMKQV